jgi:hypothetical protein
MDGIIPSNLPLAGEESDKGGIMAASGEDADLGAAAALL